MGVDIGGTKIAAGGSGSNREKREVRNRQVRFLPYSAQQLRADLHASQLVIVEFRLQHIETAVPHLVSLAAIPTV